mmetsp:Transcript_14044/g.32560  ORF Transcript_14044/g.32560 Transcript_14044/m.32560 type:complete len:537 (+) Transcript_14044:31-1641(+)
MAGMSVLLAAILAVLLEIGPIDALPRRPWRASRGHTSGERQLVGQYGGSAEKTFDQWLDHFDGANTATWRQRYFVNASSFASNSSFTPVVFLCMGGEGPPLTADVVKTGEEHCGLMVSMAERHGALVLALEHRFYGKSIPTPDLSTASLRFLSTEQALEDMASFHAHITDMYSLSPHTRWVTFGGSYPGMLAAWSRSKYPHLIHASVSSSAPLRAVANMYQYNDLVAKSLSNRNVGGSPTCLRRVRDAFAEMGGMLGSMTGRAALGDLLGVCGGKLDMEKEGAGALVADSASAVFEVQSNDPSCTAEACNIEKQCGVMVANITLSPLVQLASLVKVAYGGKCVPIDYNAEVAAPLLNTTVEGGGDRVWFYQTCSQYGFYQTCDPYSQCPFVRGMGVDTLGSYYALCSLAFGINGTTTEARVAATNQEFGGLEPGASRILFVNGDIDPWHALSPLTPRPGLPAFVVRGASHHFWTHPARPTDSPEVVMARKRIAMAVDRWLSMASTDELGAGQGPGGGGGVKREALERLERQASAVQ